MRRPSKHKHSHALTPRVLTLAAVLCFAISPLAVRNALHAQDLTAASINTVTKMDSLFRTVFDPEVSPGKGKGWKPYNRMAWLYGQRAFPSGEIPAGARMQAWEAKQSQRRRSSLDENWTAIGPANMAGRMLCIRWHPTNTNIIYVGSASGGLWKTTNGGTSWTPLTDDLPSLAIGAIALDPADPNIVFIGTGEGSFNIDAVYGGGIFKSTDGGATWNVLSGMSWQQSESRAVNSIIIHPTNSQVMWAATNISGSGGVYKTSNGGTSWTRYLYGDAKDLEIDPTNANTLYAALGYPWGSSSNGVYKSTDGGVAWTLSSTGLPSASSMGRLEIALSPSSPQVLYAGISQTLSSGAGLLGFYKSTNGGASWTLQASTPNFYSGQGWYNLVCEVHPTDPNTVFSSGLDCYKSTNSGVNWTQKTVWYYSVGHSMYAHADHHALAFMPGNPNTVLIGTDGGIFKSTNGGDTWTGLNSGLVTYQFYAMGHDVLNSNVCYGGTQDNGTNKYTGSSTWSAVLGGDGGYCNVDYTNSNIVYAETQRGSHYKSTNAGSSWSSIQSGISGYGAWVTPVEMDPANPNILYTSTTAVYRSTNGGSSWSAVSSSLNGQYVSTIAVAPSNSSVVYAGTEYNGQVWRTTNGGTNWSNVSTGLPYRYITRVVVHPTDANTAFATVSGYGTGHVWKTTNGGGSWSSISSGLPDIPCNAIVLNQTNPLYLYVGTDLGVYVSTNGGTSWTDYSTGLPNVVVADLKLHPTTGMLRAATHGRGMWETATGVPTITVLSPNGGETWTVGSSQTITWSSGGVGGNVSIEINRSYPGGSWETLLASTPNDGNQAWTVAGSVTSSARIRVTSLSEPSATDESNGNFAITQAQLTILYPNGGEALVAGRTDTIRWTLTGATGSVAVEFQRNYPSSTWTYLGLSSANSYNWAVTTPTSSTVRVRAYLLSNPTVMDTSNANFSIVEPAVTVTAPNGSEQLTPGSTYIIRWSQQYVTGTKKVEINRTYPTGSWETLHTAVSADSLVWIVDQNATSAARIRVTVNSYTSAQDMSDANFTIRTPTLAITTPNGGEQWTAGTAQIVRWNRANLDGPVNLHVNRTYPSGSWEAIAVNVTADTFAWTVSTPYSNAARIRVSAANIPSYTDESNANFSIGTAIVVTAPNGAESWAVGSQQTIAWTRYSASGNATVQVNRTYPSGAWESLTTTASGDNYVWTVTAPGTSTARVRVFLTSSPAVSDTSNADFTIPAPALVVTAPNGGEVWTTGSSQTISWSRNNANGNVTVQLNRAYPGASWETLTTTASGNSINWTVAGTSTTAARIRIYLTSSTTTGDTSDANFSIGTPALTMLAPAGGETWLQGATQTIRWSRAYAPGNVAVQINRNYPSGSWETISASVAADSLQWTVTGSATSVARVRVYLVSSPGVVGMSAANFAIAVPTLTVASPDGGEAWLIGSSQTIQFTRSNADGAVTVQLNRSYPGGTWETISSSVTTSSVAWTPQGTPSATCRVRAYLNAIPACGDTSNANFSLVNSSLTVTAPNGGESLPIGQTTTITWTRFSAAGAVAVALNRSYPSGAWETLSAADNDDSLNWTVTGAASTTARVRVTLNGNPAITDESNANFTLVQPALTLTAPAAGSQTTLGGPLTVRWTRTAAPGAVTVLLNRAYPSGTWEQLTTSAAADSFVWTSSGASSTTARAKIQLTADSSINTISGGDFSLVARSLALTSHNGGDTYYTGASSTVSFTRTNATGNVTVQLNRSYPAGTWETLSTTVSGSSYAWGISGAISSSARLRIFLNGETFVGDTSDAAFSIANPAIVLNVPNGGEAWAIGQTQAITWERRGVTDNVRVELKRSYPAGSWTILASSVAGSSYNWTVTGPASDIARIRVISTTNSALADTSEVAFSIAASSITIAAPNGGETASIGFPYVVRWSRALASGDARVELKRNYPSGVWEILGNTTADSLVWNVSGAASATARIRVYLSGDGSVGDTSAANFTIFQPVLDLTAPIGGERWRLGTERTVAWTRSGLNGPVRVEVKPDYPAGTWTTLNSGNTGNSFSWMVNGSETNTARIRIVYEDQPLYADTSGAFAVVNPSLTVVYPNGGDVLMTGTPYTLQISRYNHPESVTLQLNRNFPSGTWETLASGVTANSVAWTGVGSNTVAARLRVVSDAHPGIGDTSNANFAVLTAGVTVVSPDGGEVLALGGQTWLRWLRVSVGTVDVLLNRNYPADSWETLAAGLNSDSLLWTVTAPAAAACRIKVQESGGSYNDLSNSNFTIQQPALTLTAPAIGDTFALGVLNRIAWSRNAAATGNVRVELNRSYPGGAWINLGSTPDSELNWLAAAPAASAARVRVLSELYPWVGDTLDYNFAIVSADLTVTAPAEGQSVTAGQNLTVRWTRTNVGPGANIYLTRSFPAGPWITLATNVTADEYTWAAAAPRTSAARLRVTSSRIPNLGDSSGTFTILEPALLLTNMNGGTVGAGNAQDVTWIRTDFSGPVQLELNLNYPGGAWQTVASGLTGSSYAWTVPGTLTSTARLRVRSVDPAVEDISDANFSIVQPVLQVTYPNGNEIFTAGQIITVTWTRTAVPGNVRVELNRNYPSGTWETLAASVAGDYTPWTVNGDFAHGRIRVSMAARPEIADVSDSDFGTRLPEIYVVAPDGGDTLVVGQPYVIRWGRPGLPGLVRVELNRNYPGGAWEQLIGSTTADTLLWTPNEPVSELARIRVTLIADPAKTDVSDENFSILRQAIVLASPAVGDSVTLGMPVTFRWTRVGIPAGVNVYVKRSWPSGSWELLGSNVTADQWSWTASGSAAAGARFRVSSGIIPGVSDTTDGAVPIGSPLFAFYNPASATTFLTGENVTLRWGRQFAPGDVRVEVSRGGTGGPWTEIGVTSADSIAWTVTAPASNTVRFRCSLVSASWAAGMTSFNCTIAVPELIVAAPAAGSINALGRTLVLQWTRSNVTAPVNVYLERYSGSPLETLRLNVAGDSVHWMAAGSAADSARIVVRTASGLLVEGRSAAFALRQPALNLTAPLGGEALIAGQTLTVQWARVAHSDAVRVQLNRNYPAGAWTTLGQQLSGNQLQWTVTSPTTTTARIRIISETDASLGDTTDSALSLLVPELILDAMGRSRVPVGFPTTISWTRVAVDGSLSLYLSRDGGATWPVLLATNLNGTSHNWTPAAPAAERAKLKLQSAANPAIFTVSEEFVLALPQLVVTAPAGGETFAIGSPIAVRFGAEDHPAAVNVQLNRSYPSGSWQTIASNLSADSLLWTVSGPEASAARFRVVSAVDTSWRAESGTFAMRAASLTLTAPAVGAELLIGDTLHAAWQRTAYTAPVRVLLRRAIGGTDTLASSVSGNSASAVIAAPAASNAWIIVEDTASRVPRDSVAVGGPIVPQLALTAPGSGTRWIGGRTEVIRWSRSHASGAVEVRVNYNYPSGTWQSIGTSAADSLAFTPSGAETNAAAVALHLISRPAVADTVTGVQLVNPALSLQPLSAGSYPMGAALSAQWNAHEVDGAVVLELNRTYPAGSWEMLYTGTASSYQWTVSGAATTSARLRVRSASYPQAADTLDSDFAIVPAFIELTISPAADTLFIGRAVNLILNLSGAPLSADIQLQRSPGGAWETLFSAAAEGTHPWTVTAPEAASARLRAVLTAAPAVGDSTASFAVLQPRVQFTTGFAAEYSVGDTLHLAWLAPGADGPYRLLLVREAAAPETLAANIPARQVAWIIAPPRAASAILIVEDQASALRDTSDAFALRDPQLAFTWPVSTGVDTAGTTVNVAWSWIDGSGAVRLEVSHASAGGPWTTIADSVAASVWPFVITGPDTDSLRFRVSAYSRPAVRAVSVARRVIAPRLELGTAGGETWYIGEQKWIRWSRAHYNGNVRVEMTPGDRAAEWIELAQLAADSFLWTVTGPEAELAALRLTAVDRPSLTDTTDAPLRIASPFLQVVAPNGGEELETGQEIRLRWTGAGFSGNVALALWRGAPVNQLDTLFVDTPHDSSEIWTISGPAATECFLLIVARDHPAIFDTSDARFVITGESAVDDGRMLPREYALANPYPNPFNSTSQIEFALPRDGAVRLVVYDLLGREAAVLLDEQRRAGVHRVAWNATQAATGVYFVRMSAGDFHAVRKLHLVK